MRTVDIALMRQRGMSIADFAKRAGISSKEVSDRLKAYEHDGRDYICSVFAKRNPGAHHAQRHPEQKGR